ncbi:hypothetical protein MKL09_21330 [Methylobacterium sp. J-048]|uniref:hypothetical protein n=1 Tax=Methylobacterium sp. J-048 TaxID=2836635 RepID=UPI001FB8A563|nr:hypothetical protein [Methylobacterium sp. J-048]MCJ2059070.1 hypothetical protein [Methylobacterium sp. J-048]
MKTLLAAAIFLGSTAGSMAADDYLEFRNYFEAKPASSERTKPKASKKKDLSIESIDARRYDDGAGSKNPDNLKAGYRNRAGIYVPPDYSTHPRGPSGDGFGGSIEESYGSVSAPNPFVGSLGTRR